MNGFVKKLAVVLFALVMMGGQVRAQFSTTNAKNATSGQQNGFYYVLPQTMLKLDFIIQETEFQKGPLSEFAPNYIKLDTPVEDNDVEYKILDLKMTPVSSPDPDAMFFVVFPNGKGGKAQFDILPNGVIKSVGVGNDAAVEALTPRDKQSEACTMERIDETEDGFFSMMSSNKTNAQLAKDAADKIEEIRKAKFNLISGYYETAFHPETFQAMYQKLEDMEKDYMALLLGKRVKKTVVKTVYVVPNKEVSTQTVARFSETEGLTLDISAAGDPIVVQTLSLNTTTSINAPSQSAVESMSYDNKVFYRVPEMADVIVTCGNTTMFNKQLVINQLGVILLAPISNTKLLFDTETGQIVNLKMQ